MRDAISLHVQVLYSSRHTCPYIYGRGDAYIHRHHESQDSEIYESQIAILPFTACVREIQLAIAVQHSLLQMLFNCVYEVYLHVFMSDEKFT